MNEPTAGNDTRFYLIVCLLMGVMIAALGGLWMMERGRRVRAERAVAQSQADLLAQQQKFQMASQMLMQQPASAIDRGELPAIPVEFNKAPRRALIIGPIQGRQFGFQPDDLIWVAPEKPASQPSAVEGSAMQGD